MCLHRRIAHQARPAGEAVAAHAGERLVPRDEDCDEVGHRSSGGEDTAGRFGEPEDFAPPADHAPFDLDGGVIAAADVGVHPRREQRGDDAGRRAGTVHPAEESRMTVVDRVRRDALEERRVHVRRIGRRARQRIAGDRVANRRRNRPPRRPFANARDRVERFIERAVRERAQFRPIPRIESVTVHSKNFRSIATSSLNVCCGSTASR